MSRDAAPVTVIRIDPRVWAEAMRLAHGDARRVVIRSPRTVEVRDNRYDRGRQR